MNTYVIFLLGIDAAPAIAAFDPRAGVDKVWPGDGVLELLRKIDAEKGV
jgi:hypothetical protein